MGTKGVGSPAWEQVDIAGKATRPLWASVSSPVKWRQWSCGIGLSHKVRDEMFQRALMAWHGVSTPRAPTEESWPSWEGWGPRKARGHSHVRHGQGPYRRSGLLWAPKSFTAVLSHKGHHDTRFSLDLWANASTDGLIQHLHFAGEETVA